MKIAFSGTHCAGKTTTINAVATTLKQHGRESTIVIPEVARFCPFPINKDTSFEAQLWIVTQQMLWETRLKADILLLDRCILDEIAYALWMRKAKRLTGVEYGIIAGLALKWNEWRPIDLLLLFEPRDLIDDGMRDLDEKWQKEIASNMRSIVKRFHLSKQRSAAIIEGRSIESLTHQAIDLVFDYVKESATT